mgnify:CR=1 FL=1
MVKLKKICEKQDELIKLLKGPRYQEVWSKCLQLESEISALKAEQEEEIYPKAFFEWFVFNATPFVSTESIEWTFSHIDGIDTKPLNDVFDYWKTQVNKQ